MSEDLVKQLEGISPETKRALAEEGTLWGGSRIGGQSAPFVAPSPIPGAPAGIPASTEAKTAAYLRRLGMVQNPETGAWDYPTPANRASTDPAVNKALQIANQASNGPIDTTFREVSLLPSGGARGALPSGTGRALVSGPSGGSAPPVEPPSGDAPSSALNGGGNLYNNNVSLPPAKGSDELAKLRQQYPGYGGEVPPDVGTSGMTSQGPQTMEAPPVVDRGAAPASVTSNRASSIPTPPRRPANLGSSAASVSNPSILDRIFSGQQYQSSAPANAAPGASNALIQNGKINWGDESMDQSGSMADFVRASKALQDTGDSGMARGGAAKASGKGGHDAIHKALEIIHHLIGGHRSYG